MALKPSQNSQSTSNCKDEEDSQMECDEVEILPSSSVVVPCIENLPLQVQIINQRVGHGPKL